MSRATDSYHYVRIRGHHNSVVHVTQQQHFPPERNPNPNPDPNPNFNLNFNPLKQKMTVTGALEILVHCKMFSLFSF